MFKKVLLLVLEFAIVTLQQDCLLSRTRIVNIYLL